MTLPLIHALKTRMVAPIIMCNIGAGNKSVTFDGGAGRADGAGRKNHPIIMVVLGGARPHGLVMREVLLQEVAEFCHRQGTTRRQHHHPAVLLLGC